MPLPESPLLLPEVLIDVFSILKDIDSPTLASVIRVNSLWFECGISVLWRDASCEVLAAIGDEERRQLYAAQIQSLHFSGDEESALHETFKTLTFSSLKGISLDSYRPDSGTGYHLRQYFSPALLTFRFYGGHLDDELLTTLRNQSWKLRHLLMDSPGPDVSAEGFLRFISESTTLQDMKFLYGMDRLVNDELIVHLASRPDLTRLAIGRLVSSALLERISTAVAKPFHALRYMRIKLSTTDLPILLTLLPHVTGLDLQLVGPGEDVLEHISVMRQLELLKIEFEDTVHLEKKSLLSLARLGKLRDLHIDPDANVSSLGSGFSDADFKEVVSKLPDLERLTFHVQSDLSAVSLLSLAKHCPRLEICTMPHMFDMDQLGLASQSKPLFPKLQELSLGGFEAPPLRDADDNAKTSAADLAALLHRHMPRLTELYLDSDEEYSEAVLDAFDQ